MGLPLDWKDMQGNEISPLYAVIVLHGLDKEGHEVDSVMHTDGMSLSRALGMVTFARVFIENEVLKQLAGDYAFDAGTLNLDGAS